MQILTEPWLKVMEDGSPQTIPIANLVNPKVSDLAFSRADFNGAVYQMLIGLLQTAMPPKDIRQWQKLYYEPPTSDELTKAFAPYHSAFNLFTTELNESSEQPPAFMQDLTLSEGKLDDIAGLLLDAPGENGIKNNTDHFIKRGVAKKACASCCAAALYTRQTFANAAGKGYRTSIRGGGGGLASLVIPAGPATLWQKLWLNIVLAGHKELKTEKSELSHIFPWLVPTSISTTDKMVILPLQVNPLQMYWGMPCRIRLHEPINEPDYCDLCGDYCESLFHGFTYKGLGNNYGDGWQHVLTPYRHDKKNKSLLLSVKGKQGGLAYSDWLGLSLGDSDGVKPAAVVKDMYLNKRRRLKPADRDHKMWCYGFDMDKAKARCWYEHEMPFIEVSDASKEIFEQQVQDYINLASETFSILRQSVKQAWANRPKDLKGNTSKIDATFWSQTESEFFDIVQIMAKLAPDSQEWAECDDRWRKYMLSQLLSQFEHWALDRFTAERDMKRIIEARIGMKRIFYKSKAYSKLKQRIEQANKEAS